MSEPKFTPGPWLVMANQIGTQETEIASICLTAQIRLPKDETKANAHLIAAAPRMYDALLSASRVFRMYEEHHALKGAMDKAEANGSIADDIEKLLAEARGDK